MNIENTQSQMRKGVLEYCILAIIRRNEAYPGDIIDEMKNAGLQLLEGTLYPLLNRLKNAEILNYRWVESTSGPPRKYFTLTEKGDKFYELLESTWVELSTGVDEVINGYVPRPDKLTIHYYTVDGEEKTIRLKDYPAIVSSHEIDHLNGILFIDHLSALKRKLILTKLLKEKEKQR